MTLDALVIEDDAAMRKLLVILNTMLREQASWKTSAKIS